jgi:hypothetical protein
MERQPSRQISRRRILVTMVSKPTQIETVEQVTHRLPKHNSSLPGPKSSVSIRAVIPRRPITRKPRILILFRLRGSLIRWHIRFLFTRHRVPLLLSAHADSDNFLPGSEDATSVTWLLTRGIGTCNRHTIHRRMRLQTLREWCCSRMVRNA